MLEPACGDGKLIALFLSVIGKDNWDKVKVVAHDTDSAALELAKQSMVETGFHNIVYHNSNFLDSDITQFDFILQNPPYARAHHCDTKLGQNDLYQQFLSKTTKCLSKTGTAISIVPNRFMNIKTAESLRAELDRTNLSIIDLGDTGLFDAAVLPAILVQSNRSIPNIKVYATNVPGIPVDCISEAIHSTISIPIDNICTIGSKNYRIGVGEIVKNKSAWVILSLDEKNFVEKIIRNSYGVFSDTGKVKVGIKTACDSVFVYNTTKGLELEYNLICPKDTLRGLVTTTSKKVLYPNIPDIDIFDYPASLAYLQQHKEQLSKRKYLLDSGREWYELWVPQNILEMAKPKLVWPDITNTPAFAVDFTKSIVSGSCYWLTTDDVDLLYLMMVTANSPIISKYYDCKFNNKLYNGARRYMSQYVSQFPLLDKNAKQANEIISLAKENYCKNKSEIENALLKLLLA